MNRIQQEQAEREEIDCSVRAGPWYRRYPAAQFLVALALAFVSSPFTEALKEAT
jgi:hypothetical protein